MLPQNSLRPLVAVIVAKIAITAIGWVPIIVPSECLFRCLKVPVPHPMVFANLLGAAFLSLLVGYVIGLREALAGRYPATTVRVGIVSNGLAALLLAFHGFGGAWSSWEGRGQLVMWGSLVATTLITAGLFICGPARAGLRASAQTEGGRA